MRSTATSCYLRTPPQVDTNTQREEMDDGFMDTGVATPLRNSRTPLAPLQRARRQAVAAADLVGGREGA